jgi:hypothetical protein
MNLFTRVSILTLFIVLVAVGFDPQAHAQAQMMCLNATTNTFKPCSSTSPLATAVATQQPYALVNSQVTTGGTSVIVINGPCNGGFVLNPVSAAGQGLGATENLYIDMVGTPGSTDATGNGTTSILTAGQSFTIPPLPSGATVKVNATSSGHKFSGEIW